VDKSQNLTVLSEDPEAKCLPSPENVTDQTVPECPSSVCLQELVPVADLIYSHKTVPDESVSFAALVADV
jgi:hypothetical protein